MIRLVLIGLFIGVAPGVWAQSSFNKFKAQKFVLEGARKLYQNQYQASLSDFMAAAQLDPYNPDVYQFRAEAQYRLGNYQASLEDFDRAIIQHSNSPELYYRRGVVHEQLRNYREALYNYQDALARNSQYNDAWVALRRVRGKLGMADLPPNQTQIPSRDEGNRPYNPRDREDVIPAPDAPDNYDPYANDPWSDFESRAMNWYTYTGNRLDVGGVPNDYVLLDGIYITPSSTYVKFTVRNSNRSPLYFYLERPRSTKAFYLTDRLFQENYRLTGIFNGSFGRVRVAPGASVSFALEFERIPDDIRHLHLRAGQTPGKDAWNFYNIFLKDN